MIVLFDMDGTLLRLEVDIEEARLRLAALFRPHGVVRPFRPILQRIHEAAREAGSEELRAQALALLDDFEVTAARNARAREGAIEVVRELALRQTAMGLVTDNGRACVPAALAAAGFEQTWFRAVVTRDDVATPKPDPAGVVSCAQALLANHPAGPLWYMGDHPKDVQAGRAAAASLPGLRVAGILSGLAGEAELRAAGPDAILPSLRDVLALHQG